MKPAKANAFIHKVHIVVCTLHTKKDITGADTLQNILKVIKKFKYDIATTYFEVKSIHPVYTTLSEAHLKELHKDCKL